MADLNADIDEQDQSEVFDEDNTNDVDRGPGEEAEQFEDLVDVYDFTFAVGDDDDEEALIGEEMDDAEIVASASDEDDTFRGGAFEEDDTVDLADADPTQDFDAVDKVARRARDEVELEYAGDLHDYRDAASAAQDLEADTLSDDDLRELDYKDEFTVDDDRTKQSPDRPFPTYQRGELTMQPTTQDRDRRRHRDKDGRTSETTAREKREREERQEALLDEGVEETFPASDPVSVKRIT